MTSITIDRAVVEQALEALEYYQHRKLEWDYSDEVAITALKAALAQEQAEPQGCATEEDCTKQPWCRIRRECQRKQAKPLNLRDPAVQKRLATQWGYVPAAQAEPDLSRCPQCNGPADNGFDRSIPPSPYLCTKCMAEPVAPVAWRTFDGEGGYDYRTYEDNEHYAAAWAQRNPNHVGWVEPLYIAPPQRKLVPLTEEEIMHIGMTHQSLRQVARAVERAHGIT